MGASPSTLQQFAGAPAFQRRFHLAKEPKKSNNELVISPLVKVYAGRRSQPELLPLRLLGGLKSLTPAGGGSTANFNRIRGWCMAMAEKNIHDNDDLGDEFRTFCHVAAGNLLLDFTDPGRQALKIPLLLTNDRHRIYDIHWRPGQFAEDPRALRVPEEENPTEPLPAPQELNIPAWDARAFYEATLFYKTLFKFWNHCDEVNLARLLAVSLQISGDVQALNEIGWG